jgi:hypothetical protein
MVTTRDDVRQRITIRAVGSVSLEDLLSVVRQQHTDGTWHHAVLYDLRGAVRAAARSDIRRPADEIAAMNPSPRGPIADVRLYVLACTYAALIQRDQPFQVFHDLREAEL